MNTLRLFESQPDQFMESRCPIATCTQICPTLRRAIARTTLLRLHAQLPPIHEHKREG